MDFKYKSQKEVNELDEANFEIYAKELKKYESEMQAKAIKDAVSDATEKVKADLKTEYDAKLKAHQDHLDILDVKSQSKNVNTKTNTLVAELKAKKTDLKSIRTGMKNNIEIKAATTAGGSISGNASGFFLPNIGQLGVKERTLYNVLPKRSVTDSNNGGKVRYYDWDEATTVRAADFIGENEVFPESTAKFKWYSEDIKKIGDTLPVSEEFFEDEAMASGELSRFLVTNVDTKIDNALAVGDGVGDNIKGLLTYAPAYTAVASGIPSANLKDLAIKVRNDITRLRGSKYRPDMVAVSSATMEGLVLAKDANNNYIFDENTGTLGGLIVVVDENIPDNQIVVGERKFAEIFEKTGLVISKGMVNAQFNEDMETIKVRKRLTLIIRNSDLTGFRKVTDVTAALATLTATP